MALDNYDVMFTIASGTNAGAYGFMLSTPKNSTKQLSLREVGGPNVERVRTETEATQQDFNPEQDTPFSVADYTGGMGQLEHDGHDPNMYWWGKNVVTHVPGKVYLSPPATNLTLPSSDLLATGGWFSYIATSGVQYDFMWAGTHLYRRSAADSTTNWTLVYTASFNITSFVVFNGVGVIATPSSTTGTEDFFTQADPTAAATWTPTARNHTPFSNGTKPKYLAASRGTLFAAVDYGKVYFTVDPTQDGWAGPISVTVSTLTGNAVGDGTHAFVGLKAVNDYMFAFRTDAGYGIDKNQIPAELFWQWKDRPKVTNFQFVAAGGDNLFYTILNEVYLYDPTTGLNTPLNLARQSGYAPLNLLGMAADNQYLYVLGRFRVPTLASAIQLAILRGSKAGPATFAFEPIWVEDELDPITIAYDGLAAFPKTNGTRLYWRRLDSAGTSTTNTMDVPHDWDETLSGNFASSGILYTSISRANFPGLSKRALWITLQTTGTTSASLKVAVAYSTDNGATFTALGDTGVGGAGTLITKLDYAGVNGRSIVLRFTLTGTGTATPVLRVFDHHQRVRFRYLEQVMAALRIDNFIERNNGSAKGPSVEILRANLLKLRQEEGDISYEDFIGNNFRVSFDRYEYRPSRHEQPHSKSELEAQVTCHRADSGV